MSKHSRQTIDKILELDDMGYSSREIAKIVWGKKTKKSTVGDILRREKAVQSKSKSAGANILFIDLEVSATIAATFPRFKASISPQAVIQEPYLLTAAWAKVSTGMPDKIEYDSLGLHQLPTWADGDYANDVLLCERLWELLDDADIVIAHNAGFDTGWMNTRFAYHGMPPTSSFKTICTLKALRKEFSLPSNSLEASTNYFELDRKLSHEGIGMWLRCMDGDVDAMNAMLEYNEGDIPTLVGLYNKIKPFMKNHPNIGLYYDDSVVRCNTCGSDDLEQITGKYYYTTLSKFETLRCKACGAQSNAHARIFGQKNRWLIH